MYFFAFYGDCTGGIHFYFPEVLAYQICAAQLFSVLWNLCEYSPDAKGRICAYESLFPFQGVSLKGEESICTVSFPHMQNVLLFND